jgi:hypothetical protein
MDADLLKNHPLAASRETIPVDGVTAVPETTGLRIARLLQRLAKLDQVHIIGCSRSGTTAVQFAMIAFRDVIIANGETSANYPYLGPLFGHLRERDGLLKPAMLITKRNPGWHRAADLAALASRVQRDGVGIIHLVRDPRDVMSSVHAKAADTPYVTPELWLQGIRAAETIRASMPPGGRYLTLRYEDFVLDPRKVESALHAALGLQLRPNVKSVAEVKTNIEQSGYRISAGMLANMHRLRNMDADSLYRWRRAGFDLESRITDPDIRGRVAAFITEFGYPD